MHDWLSQCKNSDPTWWNLISFINCLIHITSLVDEALAIYFALVEDNAIICCCLLCNDIVPPTKINT